MARIPGAVYHALVLAVLGTFLSLLIANLRRLHRLEDEPPLTVEASPFISVLIPARNEAHNLPRCLESLLRQDYPCFDVTVLDDGSSDATDEVVRSFARRDARVRLIAGDPLAEGWTGKPWACQQLGEQSDADILLFIDADTWFEASALSRSAGVMQREDIGLLSVMPRQETGTIAERLVIPGLYMSFLCGMPLWRIGDPRYPGTAAANGQFMCFNARTYHLLGGHAVVQDQIVDDIAFARVVKRSGFRLTARTALDTVHCRMYRSWRDVLDGFSKNAYGAVGERPVTAFAYIALVLGPQVVPTMLCITAGIRGRRTVSGFWLPMIETGLLIVLRLLVSQRMMFRRRYAPLAPLAGLAAVVVTLRSVWWKYRGGYQWKGRSYRRTSLLR